MYETPQWDCKWKNTLAVEKTQCMEYTFSFITLSSRFHCVGFYKTTIYYVSRLADAMIWNWLSCRLKLLKLVVTHITRPPITMQILVWHLRGPITKGLTFDWFAEFPLSLYKGTHLRFRCILCVVLYLLFTCCENVKSCVNPDCEALCKEDKEE